LLADRDPSLQQLGFVLQSRLLGWRGDPTPVRERAKQFTTRMGATAGSIFKFLGELEKAGTINDGLWHQLMRQTGTEDEPRRQYLMRLQVFAELALLLGEPERSLEALEIAYEQGFLDVTWMDHCPLLTRITGEPRFVAVRRNVADRAARVLAAFHSASV
jgi:hypothetical protein